MITKKKWSNTCNAIRQLRAQNICVYFDDFPIAHCPDGKNEFHFETPLNTYAFVDHSVAAKDDNIRSRISIRITLDDPLFKERVFTNGS